MPLSRLLTALAAASVLAACQGGAATAPLAPQDVKAPQSGGQSAQSATRSTDTHKAKAPAISANPASLEFTADQAAAGTPQTVTISAKSDGKLSVSIAGTGNCPAVSPASLKPKRTDEDGDKDHDRKDGANGVITVTPAGAGPATCTITVASAKHGDDNDGHHGSDGDRHDGDHHDGDGDGANATLTIPVIVDAPATPAPTPTPVPTPNVSPTPSR
jgi:hypothetical protein